MRKRVEKSEAILALLDSFQCILACVASVSARVCRESWDESKKKGMTGEGEGKEGTPALTFAQ